MNSQDIINNLEKMASHDPKDLAGMARFGINVDKAWVISIPKLRKFAKEAKSEVKMLFLRRQESMDANIKHEDGEGWEEKLHKLALEVWDSGIHEAKILAGFIDEPGLVTEAQMEKWSQDFDSWDVVDMVCGNLFDRTKFAVKKAKEWSKREEEFVKRAGFVIMAGLSVHDKKMEDEIFVEFLKIIECEAYDERNFVRKAVSWALRQIGKSRNKNLYEKSLQLAEKLYKSENKSERWIGSDAYRELTKEYIKKRFV